MPTTLTDSDMEPVRALLESVRQSKKLFIRYAVTWMDAFQVLKRLELTKGLPSTPDDWKAYGVITADLKSTGKFLSLVSDALIDWDETGFSRDDFEACLRMVTLDDRSADDPLSDEEDARLTACFTQRERQG